MSFFYPQNLLTAVPFWGAEGTGASSWEKAAAKQTYRMQYCDLALHQVAIQCRYDRMLPLLMERPTGDLPEKVLLMRHDARNPGSAIPSECADVTALFTFRHVRLRRQNVCRISGPSRHKSGHYVHSIFRQVCAGWRYKNMGIVCGE